MTADPVQPFFRKACTSAIFLWDGRRRRLVLVAVAGPKERELMGIDVLLTFSWSAMESAAEGLRRLRKNVRRLAGETRDVPSAQARPALRERFRAAIADDLNVPGALAVTWEALREANRAQEAVGKRGLLELVLDFDRVLGLRLAEVATPEFELLCGCSQSRRRFSARLMRPVGLS